jgi:hypothetical protein
MGLKKKPQPLAYSLRLIEEERVNVEKRTQRRIAMLFAETDKTVDKATQTEIPMREVLIEVIEWHGCTMFIVIHRQLRICCLFLQLCH